MLQHDGFDARKSSKGTSGREGQVHVKRELWPWCCTTGTAATYTYVHACLGTDKGRVKCTLKSKLPSRRRALRIVNPSPYQVYLQVRALRLSPLLTGTS